MRPGNVLSIARGCGLPRDAVRRKLVMLAERGYIYRSDEGHLHHTAAVGGGFEGKNVQLIEELLAAARRPESLLTV